jgi:exodeoxyribonuclease VII large subunit
MLAVLGRRHAGAALRSLDRRRGELRALLRALPQSESIFTFRRQQLDNLESRLIGTRSKAHDRGHLGLARLSQRLARHSPQAKMARDKARLAAFEQRLGRYAKAGNDRRHQALEHLAARLVLACAARAKLEAERAAAARQRLDAAARRMRSGFDSRLAAHGARVRALEQVIASLDYRKTLARGFALVRDENQTLLRRAAEVADDARLDIEFADGRKTAIAATEKNASPLKRRASGGRRKREQGLLF